MPRDRRHLRPPFDQPGHCCTIVVRPDQYVARVFRSTTSSIGRFLDDILIDAQRLSRWTSGAVIMMFGATYISDRLSSRGHSARATRALTTTAFLVVGGIALATLPLIGAPAMVVAVFVLGYGCASVALPMMNAVVSQITPAHQLSGTLGIFLAIQNLSGLIAPVTVGILVDRAATPQAGYSLAYQIFGLSILIGALAIFLLVHPERDAARVQAQLDDRQLKATVRA